MWQKIAIAGGVGATVLGVGTAAMAVSGSPTPTPAAGSSSAPKAGNHAGKNGRDGAALTKLRGVLHAQWVTEDGKTNTTVTHDAIRGDVSAVSPSSISVKAKDGVTQTYSINSTTKVHTKGQAKGATGSITAVKAGDTVVVLGTGTNSLAATRIVDAS